MFANRADSVRKGGRRLQGRAGELEDALRVAEILERVLAQIDQ